MENLLSQESKITRLSRNEKLHADCLYLLSSESISQTLYFESKKDILFAHRLISRHLRNILDVVSYLFTPEGWIMIVRIKSEESIIEYLKHKRKKRKDFHFDISREISEHLRYMISGLAKAINARTGRKGTLVSRTFSRYICIDVESAMQVIERLEKLEYNLSRQKRRYKASMRYWDVEGEFQSRASVFLCSRGRARAAQIVSKGSILLSLALLNKDLLQAGINRSIIHHFNANSRQKSHSSTRQII